VQTHDVQLLGAFRVSVAGRNVGLPHDCQRLVAFLSVHDGHLPRVFVAGSLWQDTSDDRALGCLRSALWRVRQRTPSLIDADAHTVALADGTRTDLDDVADFAKQLEGDDRPDRPRDYAWLAKEFLPGWYDEWVVDQRERLRQLCLHSLESVATQLARRGDHSAAIQALLASISLDALREAPRRQLISVHLAEGNPSEAIRVYNEFTAILQRELQIAPSPAMAELLR